MIDRSETKRELKPGNWGELEHRVATMWLVVFLLMSGGMASGCARSVTTVDSARDLFAAGDLSTAREALAEISETDVRLSDAAELDLSIVELAAGDVRAAESRLRTLRDRFDALPEFAVVGEATAMVTDDNARRFRPAGYEEIMIRALLAVCSLAGDGSDAESYVLQAAMKQAELGRLAEQRGILDAAKLYQPIALAPYLRGVIREATHHDYDDAARAYQLVSAVQPDFAPAAEDIARASGGTHSAPGHGVLYIIGCVGRGPVLEETTAPTTSAALSIASGVLNAKTNREADAESDEPFLPNLASVKVPRVILPECRVAAVGARVNGNWCGVTQTLTDVGTLAQQQTEAEMPWTIARAVVRRVAKESTVTKVGDSLGLEGTAGSLFHFATATVWSGVEKADTRCWGLLPREIQVLRIELPTGRHDIQVQPVDISGQTLSLGDVRPIDIIDGRNHYLITVAPDHVAYLVGGSH